MGKKTLAAVDFGASSGKMAVADFDGAQLRIREYRDFVNRPVFIGTALYWDVFSFYNQILDGLAYCKKAWGEPDTAAVDTWGATYGLLDRQGRLLEPVYHYRDNRTASVIQQMRQVLSDRELFDLTGCQCNRTYTLPQLYSCVAAGEDTLERADKLLFLPDLLSYFLCGSTDTEKTFAGTSCLLDTTLEQWSLPLLEKFRIPSRLFTPLTDPGTLRGRLSPHVRQETGLTGTRLVAAVEHDSASAVAAIPNFGEGKLYISVGTAVSMGVERRSCLLGEEAFRRGFKNTGGIGGSKIVYRDFSACWLINEFRRSARETGTDYSHPDLMRIAEENGPAGAVIDSECAAFNEIGGDIREKINDYLRRTGQRELEGDGAFIRCILESIALKIAHYARAFREVCGEYSEALAINGGTRNVLLMQYVSSALGRPLKAGIPYATLAGNLLTQLYATGDVSGVDQMREISAGSFEMREYLPQDAGYWSELTEKFESICK